MVNQNSFIFIACRPSGIIAILFWLCIALLLSGDASAANLITNGGFETGDLTGWTEHNHISVTEACVYSGTYGCSHSPSNLPPGMSDDLLTGTGQTIDFTYVDELEFYHSMATYGNPKSNAAICVYFYDGTVERIWTSSTGAHAYTYECIDVSGYSGVHSVFFSAVVATGPPGSYSFHYCFDDIVADATTPTININTRVTHADTPLTGIIVNDENSTGGFPNENGERYLTPNEKASKEYIIDLSGNELQDGFKLEVSASSAEVTKLTIDIKNLVASRNYDVYLDDQWIEKIGEVTTYQYDITSFSLHTLELVYATGEEEDEGGGSGDITPPDEDILPPEDEIIIEDDVITIGNLTLTKKNSSYSLLNRSKP